ncbi:MAG: glutamine amidotransferase [Proteobacteria bacterium]|nr:glutamine amidotransferase [Pseudomonadota bacterium]
MNDRILIIVHGDRSTPGRVGRQLREMGYALDRCQPSGGSPLPKTLDDHAGAIVFGGPMSANDDNALDFIRAELEWIPTALDSGKPFLGICLGAQMLARVLGAKVEPHPAEIAEIGYYPVRPLPAGAHLFDREALFYQWHQEGFELPRGATALATAEAFENQAFRYRNAYGIQFHPEVTGRVMRTWTQVAEHRLSLPGAQARDEQIRRQAASERHVCGWLRRFLDVWLNAPDAAPPAHRAGG